MTATETSDLQQLAKARLGLGGAGLKWPTTSCRGDWLDAPHLFVR